MKLTVKELVVFGMLAALMVATTWIMSFLPNIHLVDVFIIAMTVVYRQKALYPLYLFVFVQGLFNGFQPWWLPYLYIWAFPWLITMLLPKKMPVWLAPIVYAVVASLHGFLFGVLYAPAQALMFGLTFEKTIAWIIAGLPFFDITHGVSNFICGLLLIFPLIKVLSQSEKYISK